MRLSKNFLLSCLKEASPWKKKILDVATFGSDMDSARAGAFIAGREDAEFHMSGFGQNAALTPTETGSLLRAYKAGYREPMTKMFGGLKLDPQLAAKGRSALPRKKAPRDEYGRRERMEYSPIPKLIAWNLQKKGKRGDGLPWVL